MKKNPRIGQRIKTFRERHYASQKALADALGLGQTVVSAWETGDNVPSCEAWVKLASVAPSPDNLWFLRQAGLDREIIIAAAKACGENILIRPKEGEMILVPRFRETKHGREEAGPPMRFEAEYAPNPLSTISLVVDEKSDRFVESPKGLLIVDASYQGAENLDELWDRVVVVDYGFNDFLGRAYAEGLYVGRLLLSDTSRTFLNKEAITITAFLQYISADPVKQNPSINSFPLGQYIDPESLRGLSPQDEDGFSRRWEEIKLRARSGFRLPKGVGILGKVIGRLTGHLGK